MTKVFRENSNLLMSSFKSKMNERNITILVVADEINQCLLRLIQLCNEALINGGLQEKFYTECAYLANLLENRINEYVKLSDQIQTKFTTINVNQHDRRATFFSEWSQNGPLER